MHKNQPATFEGYAVPHLQQAEVRVEGEESSDNAFLELECLLFAIPLSLRGLSEALASHGVVSLVIFCKLIAI
jgi:hypothetical protein